MEKITQKEDKKMNKRKWRVGFLVAVMSLMVMGSSAMAKSTNPLKSIPKRSGWVQSYYGLKDDTLDDQNDIIFKVENGKKYKISVTSSNERVATVKEVNGSFYDGKSGKVFSGKYYKIERKKFGETDITFTLKSGKNIYTKTMHYTVCEYNSPFKAARINGKSVTAQLSKIYKVKPQYPFLPTRCLYVKGVNAGKWTYKLKKRYKIILMTMGTSRGKGAQLKNGQTLPKDWLNIYIQYKDTKTGIVGELEINKK